MEKAAATRIQAVYRGCKVRQKFKEGQREFALIFGRLETDRAQTLEWDGLFRMPSIVQKQVKENQKSKIVENVEKERKCDKKREEIEAELKSELLNLCALLAKY